ncbi:hypothetical protein HOLleu_27797 [Holothuria leucospilota]|uniref:Endonuclease/exonuclease/phosphatase domain-containing protein n=1 Tax=Holothuria leucospilota TaxID=206669 RepID=A0A9Q1H3Q6_HOLLE|nr:hypothetical protein HOLleu_27797 [Holothuria leucospilota]
MAFTQTREFIVVDSNCVDVTNKFSSGFSNCLWCEISFVNESCTPLVVGIIYRSPNSCGDNNQSLFESFRKVSSKRAVVFGDFNFPDIDWHSCTSGSHGTDFLEAVSDGFFTQHVLFPTRGDNCLDLVLSTDENMVRNVASGGKIGSSDHDLISFELLCFSKRQGSDKTVLDSSKANFTHAKELLTIDWVARLSHLGPAEAWSVFRNIVTDTTKLCIPLKKGVIKNWPIWMSRGVLRAARKKYMLKLQSFRVLRAPRTPTRGHKVGPWTPTRLKTQSFGASPTGPPPGLCLWTSPACLGPLVLRFMGKACSALTVCGPGVDYDYQNGPFEEKGSPPQL